MAQRATSLGPKPSLCYLFFFFYVLFGEVAQRATSLGPKPSLFSFFVVSIFGFLVFAFARKKTLFSPQTVPFLCIFGLCLPLFLFILFSASSSFTFSFFVSLLFFFLLPSFLFFIFVSGSCFFLLFFASLFQDVLLFFFFFPASCLVLFWIIMLDFFLLCILFSGCCCFLLFLLCYFVAFWFLEACQKTSLKKWKFQKYQKWKMQKKKRTFWQEQLAQLCSQIVSFSFMYFCKFCFFAENTIKIGVSAPPKKEKNTKKQKNPSVKNWSKLALKTGPSMLRNKIGPVFNARHGSFFCFFFFFFFAKSSSFCRENEIFKTKKQKKKDQFLTLEKAKLGPVFNSTAYIYIHMAAEWNFGRKKAPKIIFSPVLL